ncbi:hypothetical protein L1N85_11420 [Paenibacillus alkaliterrae]|uniref:hypothetical protein n=1 Tax=Paenibacillus alkaliterrae TaxID=320909 RepID=UPI001F2631E1|nr:hypothetical protein [Paenibacillus alkaliterrae]MCF2939046.1 hypothetical protein [Paenibacillus alkaliterrae]
MAIEIKGTVYEVRELVFEDAFHLSTILEKTNFDLKNFNRDIKGKRLTEDQVKTLGLEVATEIIGHLIRNYHKAHKEVKEILASLIGVSPQEFAKMPLTTPVKIIKELSKTVDLKDFLASAVG